MGGTQSLAEQGYDSPVQALCNSTSEDMGWPLRKAQGTRAPARSGDQDKKEEMGAMRKRELCWEQFQ